MKKILSVVLAVMMICSIASFAVSAEDKITVTLNGTEIVFADQAPTIVDGRTLVPLRAIFEALGASVEWNGETRTVTSAKGDTAISLTIDTPTLYVNGEAKTLDVPAMIINGRTMVPARAVAEAYGVEVAWDGDTRTVILTAQEEKEEEAPAVTDAPADAFFVLSGENYTGDEGYSFTSGAGIVPQIVKREDNPGDKVLFLESTYTDGKAWTYFRNKNVTFEAGARYLVSFKATVGKNAAGEDISDASLGVCFNYADSAETGKAKDHGVASISFKPGEWKEVKVVYTVPETYVEDSCNFGIFGNPAGELPISYYLDDVYLAPYTGAAEDGVQTAESLKAADDEAEFDINTAAGLVYTFEEDKKEFRFSGGEAEYKDGNLVMVAEGDTADPIIYFADTSKIDADTYKAVAVRFKAEGVPAGKDHIAVYFTTEADDKPTQSKSQMIKYADLTADEEGYYVAYINIFTNELWNGKILSLRVDPGNGAGKYTVNKVVVVAK